MARAISDIEAEIRALARAEKERLLLVLLEDLEGTADPYADLELLEEVRRRSAAEEAGLMSSSPAEEVVDRVLAQLKQMR
jgi:hypothetical protein